MIFMEKDKNTLLWILIAAVVVVFLLGSFGMDGYGMMGFGMGFGWIFMVAFWGALIWLVVTLVNQSQSHANQSRKDEEAMEIIKKRYAKGEITKKEYEEMRKELIR